MGLSLTTQCASFVGWHHFAHNLFPTEPAHTRILESTEDQPFRSLQPSVQRFAQPFGLYVERTPRVIATRPMVALRARCGLVVESDDHTDNWCQRMVIQFPLPRCCFEIILVCRSWFYGGLKGK